MKINDKMIDLRYISILTIFLSSVIGSLSPFFINDSFTPFIKMFSAGVILSLSLVHIVPDSINDLNNITDYPLGGTMILIGVLFLVIIENLSHSLFTKKNDNLLDNIHNNNDHSIDQELIDNPDDHNPDDHNPDDHNPDDHDPDDHNHVCINNLNISNLVCIPDNNYNTNASSQLILYIFEFACIFHSFIIGLSLGLMTDQDDIKKLMIALLFHQMVEGMSLGAMILLSKTKKLKSFIFIASYSLMTPLGITTGLIIEKSSISYDDDLSNSNNWIIARGCLLGISAGMLIYISLIQIILEELSKKELHTRDSIPKKIYMYLAILLGAAIMCIIALWV